MQRLNRLKAMLEARRTGIGLFLLVPDPSLVELAGIAGFDYVVLDGEHGALSPERLEHVVRASDSAGVTPILRVHVDSAEAMLPWVETGVLGIMQPHTRDRAHAQRLVDGTKYAPVGSRGMGTGRASAYGSVHGAEHVADWNREMLALAQIEDADGVANLSEILTVDGLDGCYIGSTDLAHALGFTGEASHADVRELQAKLAQDVRAAGKWVGFGARHPYDAAEGTRLKGLGADLFSFNFVGFFLKTAAELVEATRALVDEDAVSQYSSDSS
jgi:4-hydroxy-2-oxoheptanedioate aldolase